MLAALTAALLSLGTLAPQYSPVVASYADLEIAASAVCQDSAALHSELAQSAGLDGDAAWEDFGERCALERLLVWECTDRAEAAENAGHGFDAAYLACITR